MNPNNKFVVLISGNGSNLEAMCKAGLSEQIAAVISNKSGVRGLVIADRYKIATEVIEHKNFANRDSFDDELMKTIEKYTPTLVVLAGFMRILTDKFVNFYTNRLINVHPSILPAFIGANAIENALQAKTKVTGITIHFVTTKLDSGPILAQGIVPIKANDTIETLSQRIHLLEHRLYPFVIKKFLENKITISNDVTASIIHEKNDVLFLNSLNTNIFY